MDSREDAVAFYTIEPERRTLHGHFSRDLAPVLEIESGDTVRFRTLDAGWGLEPNRADGSQRSTFEPLDPELDRGHALCGPVAVRGAAPGMTLQLDIGTIRTGGWGWTNAGGWKHPVNERLGFVEGRHTLNWTIDDDAGTATCQSGRTVTIAPFMGVMGMPPAEPGMHPTSPPRPTGGNIDCRELVAGTTLYLPIAASGALFSTGDGHGVQGNGEASSTAIECPIERVDLTFTLRDDLHLTTPRARTAEGWLTLGFDEDLDEAMFIALDAMLDLLAERYSIDRREALALASVVVDLRVTQVVNGVKGVHAVLPHGAIR
jgi:acetamidase/formamidase